MWNSRRPGYSKLYVVFESPSCSAQPNVVQDAAFSHKIEAVSLSWATLIPDLPDVFYIGPTDLIYCLYQDAMHSLDTPFDPPPHACARLHDLLRSNVHSSFGKLVHLLADMNDNIPVAPLDDLTNTSTSVLDFLYAGVCYTASMNLSTGQIDRSLATPSVYCVTCTLLRGTPDGSSLDHALRYQAEFLDIITLLWEEECRARQSLKANGSRALVLPAHVLAADAATQVC